MKRDAPRREGTGRALIVKERAQDARPLLH